MDCWEGSESLCHLKVENNISLSDFSPILLLHKFGARSKALRDRDTIPVLFIALVNSHCPMLRAMAPVGDVSAVERLCLRDVRHGRGGGRASWAWRCHSGKMAAVMVRPLIFLT